ncbi:MAG: 6-carboxytetrahydropterin synthase [Bacteroidales bacterium]
MGIVRITKEFRFEGAHSLKGYDGKCKHIHGHSYILYVTVIGSPNNDINSPKNGMLIDFSVLKKIVNEEIVDKFDHALVLRKDSALIKELTEAYSNVITVEFQPTCENLISYFATLLPKRLPLGIKLFSMKLHETATSFVEWYAVDN